MLRFVLFVLSCCEFLLVFVLRCFLCHAVFCVCFVLFCFCFVGVVLFSVCVGGVCLCCCCVVVLLSLLFVLVSFCVVCFLSFSLV